MGRRLSLTAQLRQRNCSVIMAIRKTIVLAFSMNQLKTSAVGRKLLRSTSANVSIPRVQFSKTNSRSAFQLREKRFILLCIRLYVK
jgi:hypothetical protein